jgi:hypothetical protein
VTVGTFPAEGRKWMSEEDNERARLAIQEYVREHCGCTPDEVIKALGLPDMTGIPADRRARTNEHKRRAAEADLMLHYATFHVGLRDNPPKGKRRRDAESRDSELGATT